MAESILAVRLELFVVNMLVWIASTRDDADLTADTHISLCELYQRLADYHRLRGHLHRAARLQKKADAHREWFDDDSDPPPAAAMAMSRRRPSSPRPDGAIALPMPRPRSFTDAVGCHKVERRPHAD